MPHVHSTKQRKIAQQAQALRDQVLNECGWPIEKRRRLLGGALKVYEKQLKAQKAITTDDGITYVDDNQSQLRAAEAITTLEGVNVGTTHEGSSGPTNIQVVIPWFTPETTICGGSGVIEHDPLPNRLTQEGTE